MADDKRWLDDVVIVNESHDYKQVGDVSIFRSRGDACLKIEPWYATEVDYFAFSGLGVPLAFKPHGFTTQISVLEKLPKDTETLEYWLLSCAKTILSIRQQKAKKGKLKLGDLEAQGTLPNSIEGLIAYIGFR